MSDLYNLAPVVMGLAMAAFLYTIARITRDRAVRDRDAGRARRQAERTPAE